MAHLEITRAFKTKLRSLVLSSGSAPALLEVASNPADKSKVARARQFFDHLYSVSCGGQDPLMVEVIASLAVVMSVPKSGVFLEQTFSVAGQIITHRRGGLSPAMASACIALRASKLAKDKLDELMTNTDKTEFKKRGIHAKRAKEAAAAAAAAGGGGGGALGAAAAPAVDAQVIDPETGADIGDEFEDELDAGNILVQEDGIIVLAAPDNLEEEEEALAEPAGAGAGAGAGAAALEDEVDWTALAAQVGI